MTTNDVDEFQRKQDMEVIKYRRELRNYRFAEVPEQLDDSDADTHLTEEDNT